MTKTNTQNRPYDDQEVLLVRATFSIPPATPGTVNLSTCLTFNWNSRTEVRNFAAQSDRIIRMGGKTLLERV